MDTTAAATTAGVTVDTIRRWCRYGAIAAAKVAGRWIIEAASLTRRITIGKAMTIKDDIEPISRDEFERRAADLGIRATFKDARCIGEYDVYVRSGLYYDDTPYNRLMVARGKAAKAEGVPVPQHVRAPYECHFCGLDSRTCDCI